MRRGMTQHQNEMTVTTPDGYAEGDILYCEWIIESKGGVVKKKGVFCAKSQDRSINNMIRRFAQKANIFKITINPISVIGKANEYN